MMSGAVAFLFAEDKNDKDLDSGLMFRRVHGADEDGLFVYVDGMKVGAQKGESVAAVMMRQQDIHTRSSPVSGQKRAPYCMMGVCFDCLAVVDGVPSTQTCLVQVAEGMRIERQDGRTDLTS